MLKEFGWKRFYKGSNPRGNLTLSDYRREKAAEMAKEEERKLEDIKGTNSGERLQQKVDGMSRQKKNGKGCESASSLLLDHNEKGIILEHKQVLWYNNFTDKGNSKMYAGDKVYVSL